MEEGSLRCDANVSLRPRGATKLGTKAEIKNMNSFKNVRDAIEHEIKRQATLLDRGERIVQETRLWDADRGVTQAMRSKEQAHDYRYFPEPDLPPLVVDGRRAGALRGEPAGAARGSLRALHRTRWGSRRRTRRAGRRARGRRLLRRGGRRRRAGQTRRQLGHQRGAGPGRRRRAAWATPTARCRRPRWPSW